MSTTITPEVLWAQRSSADVADKNIVYITINASDIPKDSLKLELTSSKLNFSGANKTNSYAVELEFFGEIDVDASKTHHTGRGVECKLIKKELKEEFWPRLVKEPKRLQFIKTDFDKWVDEDEQEDAEELGAGMPDDGGMDFSGMGGMPGMGGMGGPGGMDMASLMQSMGGGAGGTPDFPKGDPEDDDEDMPELEGGDDKADETPVVSADTGDKKIEEVK